MSVDRVDGGARIGVRDLRQNASRYLERVQAGEVIEITNRGRLVARLVPVAGPQTSVYDQLVAEGRLIPAARSILDFEPLTRPGASLSAALHDARADER